MSKNNIGPRDYKPLSIANTVVIDPKQYLSDPGGHVMETADFTELGYFLGYKFEPRAMYAIWSTEGVARGGHMESRSKLVTVLTGMVFYCMVDLRPGADFGKVCEFYLGEGEKSMGRSVLVPEGVVDYFVPINGPALTHSVGDRPYNKFDNSRTLDLTDSAIGFHLPEGTVHHVPAGEEINLFKLEDFLIKSK